MKKQEDNMDEIDKILFEYFKSNTEIPKETVDIINKTQLKKKQNLLLKRVAIYLITFSILTTGIVFARNIKELFRNLFNLNTTGINNESIVDAIENRNYIQNVEMDYVVLNENYKIKVDYLMIDDINLYTVFNILSKDNINANYRLSILDLKIYGDNNLIYDAGNMINENDILTNIGWNKIEDRQILNEKQELLFLTSNGFPKVSELNFQFSKVVLYNSDNPDEDKIEIDCNCYITIDIMEKFINRDIIEFSFNNDSEIYKIKKCISTDTGTYLLIDTSNPEVDIELHSTNKIYNSSKILLGINEQNGYEFVLQYNITKEDISKEIILKDNFNTELESKKSE